MPRWPQNRTEGMNGVEYARHRGTTGNAVSLAKGKGWLVLYADGSINALESDILWDNSRNPNARNATHSPPNPMDKIVQQATGQEPETAKGALTRSKATHEDLKARKTELQVEQMEGALISRAHAELVVFSVLRVARDAALDIPARVRDDCAGMTDALAIGKLLTQEIRAALGVPEVSFEELLARVEE